jgi:hypothetical protein
MLQKQNFRKRARELKEQEQSSRKRIITGTSRGTKANPKGNSMQKLTPPHFSSTAAAASHSSSRLPTSSGSSSSSSAKASSASTSSSSNGSSGSSKQSVPRDDAKHYADVKAPVIVSTVCTCSLVAACTGRCNHTNR